MRNNIIKKIINKYRNLLKERNLLKKKIKRNILDKNKKSYKFYKFKWNYLVSFKLKTNKWNTYLKYLSKKTHFHYKNSSNMFRKLAIIFEYNKNIKKINKKIYKMTPIKKYIKKIIKVKNKKFFKKYIEKFENLKDNQIPNSAIKILYINKIMKIIPYEKIYVKNTNKKIYKIISIRSISYDSIIKLNIYKSFINIWYYFYKNINIKDNFFIDLSINIKIILEDNTSIIHKKYFETETNKSLYDLEIQTYIYVSNILEIYKIKSIKESTFDFKIIYK